MHRLLTRLFPSAPTLLRLFPSAPTLLLQVLVICTMTTDYISPPAHYSGLIRFVAPVCYPSLLPVTIYMIRTVL